MYKLIVYDITKLLESAQFSYFLTLRQKIILEELTSAYLSVIGDCWVVMGSIRAWTVMICVHIGEA